MSEKYKNILKYTGIFMIPVAIGATVAITYAVVKNRNSNNDSVLLPQTQKSSFSVSKNENEWAFKIQIAKSNLKTTQLSFKNASNEQFSIDATISKEDEKYFINALANESKFKNSKYTINLDSSLKATSDKLEFNWPLYEFKNSQNNTFELSIDPIFKQESFSLVFLNQQKQETTIAAKVQNNKLVISEENIKTFAKGTYSLQAIKTNANTFLINKEYFDQNPVVFSNKNIGKIENNVIILDKNNFEDLDVSKLKMIFGDKNNNIKMFNSEIENNNVKFSISSIDKTKDWTLQSVSLDQNGILIPVLETNEINSSIKEIKADKLVNKAIDYRIEDSKNIVVIFENNEFGSKNISDLKMVIGDKESTSTNLFENEKTMLKFSFSSDLDLASLTNKKPSFKSSNSKLEITFEKSLDTINSDTNRKITFDIKDQTITFELNSDITKADSDELKIFYYQITNGVFEQKEIAFTDTTDNQDGSKQFAKSFSKSFNDLSINPNSYYVLAKAVLVQGAKKDEISLVNKQQGQGILQSPKTSITELQNAVFEGDSITEHSLKTTISLNSLAAKEIAQYEIEIQSGQETFKTKAYAINGDLGLELLNLKSKTQYTINSIKEINSNPYQNPQEYSLKNKTFTTK
ncbi:hypothetical protein [Mycoplasma procyoni]|uniref:hypothetical protein n=1 Tax=Mycoplasma procyoni TaxID=568784 RepID=UPI00197BF635|nr:hypothetical protein [Mycoplasma procyoni]MBN3534707.1 hypothetical protein [Mycoplasma procyoni]